MPGTSPEESLYLLRQDFVNQSRTLTAIVEEQHEQSKVLDEMRIDKARRDEQRTALDARLNRIEKRLDDFASIGRWFLVAFFASLITAVVTFVVKGGLIVAN